MTLIPDKNQDQRVVEYGQQAVELGLEVARLENEVQTKRKEVTGLSVQHSQLVQEIKREQKRLDDMHLLTTVEMKERVEQAIADAEKVIQSKQIEITEIDKLLVEKQVEILKLQEAVTALRTDIEKMRNNYNAEVDGHKQRLVSLDSEIASKVKELQELERQVVVAAEAKDMEEQATIAARVQRQSEEEFMERKRRDLGIYERRVNARFKELYPEQEMKFI